jgi:pimeloyl-ACP methyl ester carboxylesterase
MGLASQMILWDEEFCELLAARGFWVVRFDNRDVGRSTILREAGVPKRWQLLLRDVRCAPYSLDQMADDGLGLLDHLGISAAHVVGVSMGGTIAQLMTISHPARVLSLVSIMSSTGSRRVGRPHPRLVLRMLRPVSGTARAISRTTARPIARSDRSGSRSTRSGDASARASASIGEFTPRVPRGRWPPL